MNWAELVTVIQKATHLSVFCHRFAELEITTNNLGVRVGNPNICVRVVLLTES